MTSRNTRDERENHGRRRYRSPTPHRGIKKYKRDNSSRPQNSSKGPSNLRTTIERMCEHIKNLDKNLHKSLNVIDRQQEHLTRLNDIKNYRTQIDELNEFLKRANLENKRLKRIRELENLTVNNEIMEQTNNTRQPNEADMMTIQATDTDL